MSISFRLDDKLILVTGASSGIGRALCLEMARAGVEVALVARREPELHDLAEQRAKEASDSHAPTIPS